MIVVRNVFRCKPGKASELASRFQKMVPMLAQANAGKARVLVDQVASFWTVVFEVEAEDLASHERTMSERGGSAEVREAMGDYMDVAGGGHREVFRIAG